MMETQAQPAPKWQAEFPDMEADKLPPIPEHWEDHSWHNDACPFWSVSPCLGVFVDYADAAKSDFPNDRAGGALKRFHPVPLQHGQHWDDRCGPRPDLGMSDDWNETLALCIAWEFRNQLADTLTAEEFAEVIRRNGTTRYTDGTCASHDFCDANLPMADAWQAVIGRAVLEAPDGSEEHEADCKLWNAAWERAHLEYLGGKAGRTAALRIELERRGYAVWPTGGGLEAYGKAYGGDIRILVTDGFGGELPEAPSDWWIGVYDDDEHCQGIQYGPDEFATMEAALDAAEAKADELDMEQSAKRRGDL